MPRLRWLHSLTVGCESLVAYAAGGACAKDIVLTNAKVRSFSCALTWHRVQRPGTVGQPRRVSTAPAA